MESVSSIERENGGNTLRRQREFIVVVEILRRRRESETDEESQRVDMESRNREIVERLCPRDWRSEEIIQEVFFSNFL